MRCNHILSMEHSVTATNMKKTNEEDRAPIVVCLQGYCKGKATNGATGNLERAVYNYIRVCVCACMSELV